MLKYGCAGTLIFFSFKLCVTNVSQIFACFDEYKQNVLMVS